MLLEEVEDPGDRGVLLLLRNAEGHAVHMDVEAAAAGPMAEIAQVNGFPAEFFPGHFMELAVQGHGVGHQLQTVIQRTVVLDVEELLLGVGDPEKGTGVVPVLAAAVDLKLYAKKPGPISIEDRLRFVVVIMDGLVPKEGLETVGTVGTVAVLVDLLIAGGMDPDEFPAAAAAGEVLIVAILAKRDIPGT